MQQGPSGTARLTQTRAMPTFDLTYTAIVIVGLIGGILGVCGYLTLGERKISAWMQDRVGVEEVLKHLQGEVIAFASVAGESLSAMWFAGGYPDPSHLDALVPSEWKAPALLVAQDILPTVVTASAKYVLPATTGFEKDGTFVNHAGYAQTFARAAKPPVETRSELQLAFDLLGRRGLVQPAAVRAELAAGVAFFAELAAEPKPTPRAVSV